MCALEALDRLNGVNHQFHCHVYFSRAGYERSLMEHNADERKLFHSYIRHKKRGRMAVGPLKIPCGNLVNGSYGMAELLVDTFSSVFVEGVPEYSALHQIFDGAMNDVKISVERVCSVLRSLDASSAMGPDDVHPHLLRECAAQLASPLQQIFSRS